MRWLGSETFGGRVGQGKFGENERHERALRKAGDELARRIAQHSRFVARRLVDGAMQIAGLVDGVGVGEQHPAAARFAGCGPDGIVLPCPAFFELGGLEHGDAGKAAGDFGGAVGGVVVDDDEFPVAAKLEDVFGLRDKRLKASCKVLLFVAGGNDDGEFDELFRFGLIEDGAGADRDCERLAGIIGQAEDGLECSRRSIRLNPVCLSLLPRPFVQYPSLRIIRMCGFLVSLPSVPFFALTLACGCDRGARPANADKVAPDFTVSDGENTIHLANYRGKVVLLNFWWSQCPPCVQETPALEQLHHDRPDLAILAVSIDSDPDHIAGSSSAIT